MSNFSYDVFDTLITRLVPHPSDIFMLMEKKYKVPGFAAARIRAESELRNSKSNEPNIFEIYEALIKINPKFSLMSEELEIEYKYTRPISDNLEKIKNSDCFISDMYLPANFIKALLEKNGVTEVTPGKNLFVSSEYNSTKKTGKLFKIVEDIIGPIEFHTGDHPLSDYDIPRKLGISSRLYKEKLPNTIGAVIKEKKLSLEYLIYGTVRSMLLAQKQCTDAPVISVYLSKVVPMLYCFSSWIIESAKSRGIKDIYFLARDGYLPYIIAKEIAGNEINIQYLKVSRAALQDVDSAKRYLYSQGVDVGKKIAIVDAGWHGSLQKSINELYNETLNMHGFYLGILSDNCLKETDYSAFLFSCNSKDRSNRFVTKYIPPIEFLLAAPHGSVSSIREDQSGGVIFNFLRNERFDEDLVHRLTSLVKEFTQNMLSLTGDLCISYTEQDLYIRRVIHDFRSLLACPPDKFSRAIRKYYHFESISSDWTPIVADSPSLKHLLGLNKTWWKEGTLAQGVIGRMKNEISFRLQLTKEYLFS